MKKLIVKASPLVHRYFCNIIDIDTNKVENPIISKDTDKVINFAVNKDAEEILLFGNEKYCRHIKLQLEKALRDYNIEHETEINIPIRIEELKYEISV